MLPQRGIARNRLSAESGRYRKRYGTVDHLFGIRFKSYVIEREAYLAVCGRYAERNPVRAGLVENLWTH